MGKQIVVCFDGTWNDPTESTNVHRLFDALEAGPAMRLHTAVGPLEGASSGGGALPYLQREGNGVLAFYLEGVGATGLHESWLDGALGLGLHRRVLHAYVLLSQHYAAGDTLWLFGFSRGAWSARSLAGLLARTGLLSPTEASDPMAMALAQQRWLRSKRRNEALPEGTAYWLAHDEQPVRLLGVWDTVGALGIPFFNGIKPIDQAERQSFDFADLSLSPRVAHGRQALAIDENRRDFEPTLWNARPGVQQVWFAGAHADVGGGYTQTGLSDIALQWMLDEARQLGLAVNPKRLQPTPQPDPLQDRHDESRKRLWQMRPVEPRHVPGDAELHASVFTRLQQRPDWRPAALRALQGLHEFFRSPCPVPEQLQPLDAQLSWGALALGEQRVVTVQAIKAWNASGVQVRAGERYTVTVAATHNTWHDDKISCGADGYDSPTALLRWSEGARRVDHARWFSLIGAVHASPALEAHNPNERSLVTGLLKSFAHDVGEIDEASQLVLLGTQASFSIDHDGHLYFFANDVAWAYSNNSGCLQVQLSRTH